MRVCAEVVAVVVESGCDSSVPVSWDIVTVSFKTELPAAPTASSQKLHSCTFTCCDGSEATPETHHHQQIPQPDRSTNPNRSISVAMPADCMLGLHNHARGSIAQEHSLPKFTLQPDLTLLSPSPLSTLPYLPQHPTHLSTPTKE